MKTARAQALRVLQTVVLQHQSLNEALTSLNLGLPDAQERNLARLLVSGCLRWKIQLEFLTDKLLKKPFKTKDTDLHLMVVLGLFQLIHTRIAAHAAINETVKLVSKNKSWAKPVINGVLRQFQRQQDDLMQLVNANTELKYSHPAWLIDYIRHDWPQNWEKILEQNNQTPPLILRVNQQQISCDDFLQNLSSAGIHAEALPQAVDAILLHEAKAIQDIPGYAAGWFSVQDLAAQQAAYLLDLHPGHIVLDACAAPGGKTTHCLEVQPQLARLIAIDSDQQRLQRVSENLQRLQLYADLQCLDAANAQTVFEHEYFDRILLDAPCSATGVIRRNPDIKLHRRAQDIVQVSHTQQQLLEHLWPLLKPGGKLLYATCSLLKIENQNQIKHFINQTNNAAIVAIDRDWGHIDDFGWQILPGEAQADGFFYACLQKNL
ncbi:MAG: 16S rRNA (cytosine(967)-C(5))-methyltransferase RsmB [Gammaproteobacteria bacterium]|nr:16S rRNA (cytosine(967)-C(5))-methyltransferase RsmB [Gammaproteobacteria bacterium]MDH5727537.1 16S rRNA (cytosine(967)-C(5))-methyltransferase RsmB [Gammaproteobacteria bacterium]